MIRAIAIAAVLMLIGMDHARAESTMFAIPFEWVGAIAEADVLVAWEFLDEHSVDA
jgi:hypothetical protein